MHNLVEHVLVNGGIEKRNERLDPPVEIALHEVGGRNERSRLRIGQPVASAECVYARVFQKSANERLHANIVGKAGDARPQTADAADHDVDLHPGAASAARARAVAAAAGSGRRRRPVKPGVVDLVGDVAQQRLLERDRRNRHLLETIRLSIAGDEIENAGDVASDRRIGGEKGNVGVNAGGDGVIIAGAEVTVTDQRAALAPDHHRELGVGFELDEAIDDLRTRALEIPRPADVGLFVEARLEFDERGD